MVIIIIIISSATHEKRRKKDRVSIIITAINLQIKLIIAKNKNKKKTTKIKTFPY